MLGHSLSGIIPIPIAIKNSITQVTDKKKKKRFHETQEDKGYGWNLSHPYYLF